MPMYFHHSTEVIILFNSWTTTSPSWYVFAIICVFFLSILNQFLHFVVRRKIKIPIPENDEKKASKWKRIFKWKTLCMYTVKAISCFIQMFLGYCLMLLIMTYNVVLFVMIILGSFIGWCIFLMPYDLEYEDCCQ